MVKTRGRGDAKGSVEKTRSRFLTVPELARRWAISTPHAYRMVDAGIIQSFRLGRAIRIPLAAVEAYERAQGLTPADVA
jgi:excisionase family DNA binding protein